VDGDAVEVDLEVEAGATLVVFTQASTKVFRGASSQAVRATVEGTLVLMPDPVACFRGARYRQRVDVALRGEGACVVLDGFTSGRAAYGDRWAFERLDLRTTITRGGSVVARDALRLDAADGPVAERMGRFEAVQTVLGFGGRVRPIVDALLAPSIAERDRVVAPSPLPLLSEGGAPAGAVVRIAATSPWAALAEARQRLRNLPDIDAVDPFGARH